MKKIVSIFTSPESIRIMLIFAVAITALTCLVQLIRTPPFLKWRFDKAMMRCAIRNSQGEYPTLISVRKDQNKPHGKILKISNKGISVNYLNSHAIDMEASLNAIIYNIQYAKRMDYTLIHLLPRRHVHPTIISIEDERICREPNCLIVGNTGSGKSYALLTILGSYIRCYPNLILTICDYKKSSFSQLEGLGNFYGYEDVPEGIRTVYKEFCERLEANSPERNKNIWLLLVDEYGALLAAAPDRKTYDELKTMIGNMLFMGRSLGIRVLLGTQRGDSEHFKSGARDQFRAIIGLGNLSKEQKQMLFSDFKESMTERNGVGEGYLLIDGQDIERIRIAEIPDMDALNESIKKAMLRQSPAGADGDAQREPSDPPAADRRL